jgi:soluble lytic murein transglycosylase-like protein
VAELKRISHSFWFAASLSAGLLVSSCATVKNPSDRADRDRPLATSAAAPRTVDEIVQKSNLEQPNSNPAPTPISVVGRRVDYGDLVVQGKRLKNTTFDIPITINSRVEYWVDYFTGRGRKYFTTYLERAEFFIPYMRPILKQNGMPEDLVYLAMIESGFNNFARSNAKAVGPWQFISATGKRYGLMVNWWVDERRDIRKSTIAAVEYLKELMGMFGSFELAAASYNAGEGKLARAVQRFGTKDFWAISRHRFLKPETRDYVPKIIAAALLAKNRTQFGFEPENNIHPGADEAVSSDGEVVKLIKSDKPDDRLDRASETKRVSLKTWAIF